MPSMTLWCLVLYFLARQKSLLKTDDSTSAGYTANFNLETKLVCYRVYLRVNITVCLKRCARRQGRCKYIRFDRRFRVCFLCEGAMDTYQSRILPDDIIINIQKNVDKLADLVGSCSKTTCKRTQACYSKGCRPRECELPPAIPGTFYPTNIMTKNGSMIRFDCLDNTLPECPLILKCTSKAIWSTASIQSVQNSSENIALNKVAWMKSLYSGANQFWTADKAVDGDTNHQFSGQSCTHTAGKGESHPWWRADLGAIYWINRVVIYNRAESPERLHDILITVEASVGHLLNCTYFKGPTTNLVLTFECEKLLYGQYIQIEKMKESTTALILCEVEVYSL